MDPPLLPSKHQHKTPPLTNLGVGGDGGGVRTPAPPSWSAHEFIMWMHVVAQFEGDLVNRSKCLSPDHIYNFYFVNNEHLFSSVALLTDFWNKKHLKTCHSCTARVNNSRLPHYPCPSGDSNSGPTLHNRALYPLYLINFIIYINWYFYVMNTSVFFANLTEFEIIGRGEPRSILWNLVKNTTMHTY